jgi:predicted metal-dependent peptidase
MTSASVTQVSKSPEVKLVRANLPEVKLTSAQDRQWSETLAAVNWIGPGFCHLMYSMLNKRGDSQVALFSEAIPTAAATDGLQLVFKPSEFFKLTLMERVFAVFHEISHCVGDHCGMGYQMKKRGEIFMGNKKLPYDPMLANIVQDYIINDMLIESNFGTFKKGWLHDTKIATFRDDWVEVYFKEHAKKPPGQKPPPGRDKPCDDGEAGDGQGEGTQPGNSPGEAQTPPGPGQFDQHLDPGQTEDKSPEETGPRDEQQWQQAVQEALTVAQAQGKSPAAFELHFGKMLQPKVNWADHLRALLARKVGGGGFDFQRPDRRLIVRDIVCPGRSGYGAGTIVVALDTSGSIFGDPTLIDRWMLHVVECDADIQRTTEMTDSSDLAQLEVLKGGGGTSFTPVFDWIEEEGIEPDCLLYLTDSYGTFPSEAPKYPCIWGDISGQPKNYPWGDVVEVPTEE